MHLNRELRTRLELLKPNCESHVLDRQSTQVLVSLADPFPTLRGEIRVWSLLICYSPSLAGCMDLKSVIHSTAAEYGYQLRCKQEESILAFTGGMDVFVSLPTGYGKSLCYTLLPPIYDKIRKVDRKSIVLVVSPLVALMQDQVRRITSKGISATCLADESNRRGVKNGEYQVVFVSPETLCFPEWRNMLSSDTYSENLIGFIIDEAHCIKKW